jgi:hypothetical protein
MTSTKHSFKGISKECEIQRETGSGLRKRISKNSTESYVKIIEWLYRNHLDILREYEKTLGNLRVEFA